MEAALHQMRSGREARACRYRGRVVPDYYEVLEVSPKARQSVVDKAYRTLMKECGEGGWIGAHASYERGGQQMPMQVMNAFRFIFCTASVTVRRFLFGVLGVRGVRGAYSNIGRRRTAEGLAQLSEEGATQFFRLMAP